MGTVNLSGLKELFTRIGEDPEFHLGKIGLADFREIQIDANVRDVKILGNFVMNELRSDCSLWVTLVEGPLATALSLLFRDTVSSKFGVEICSTEKRASHLLGTEVRPILDELKKRCGCCYSEVV